MEVAVLGGRGDIGIGLGGIDRVGRVGREGCVGWDQGEAFRLSEAVLMTYELYL